MGLNDRLKTKKRSTDTYPLRIQDDAKARAELAAARAAGDESRTVAAQLAIEACYEQVTIIAMDPPKFEDLLEKHPPPPEQADKKLFNPVTFVPALLAACVDSDVTVEDWIEYTTMGTMTRGEVADLFNTVWDLNNRIPRSDILKG